MPKAAVAQRTEGVRLTPELLARRDAAVTAGRRFSGGTLEHLDRMSPEGQAAWIKGIVATGSIVFQPWALEILFVLGTRRRARFTEIQRLLGLSSRTLSDKLQALREAGYVEREVFDEQPVRIEYHLTRFGQDTAALASPLVCLVNHPPEKR